MRNIKSFSFDELVKEVADIGLERYRAIQIFSWLWKHGVTDFEGMTNLSKSLRRQLSGSFYIGTLKKLKEKHGDDGTVKFLFELEDGESIESVFIPESSRKTICVSTQVGCPLGCVFCASSRIGFRRNLLAWEIIEQIISIKFLLNTDVSNVVFMGIGEPFLNLTEVLKAIAIINSPDALNIGARHITVSTAGVVDGIMALSQSPSRIKLAISLNATTDALRSHLMPINRKYPLKSLFKAVRAYARRQKVRVSFEYILIDGVNDKKADALRLAKLVRGIPCKVNLIPLNEIPDVSLHRSPDSRILDMIDRLKPYPVTLTLRKSKGSEIMAGCGQLRGGYG